MWETSKTEALPTASKEQHHDPLKNCLQPPLLLLQDFYSEYGLRGANVPRPFPSVAVW